MSEPLDYLGVKPCGCAVAWISAAHSTKREIAKEVARWIRDGLDVQRVTTEDSRRRLRNCIHKPRPARQEELALSGSSERSPT